jgi:RHS repeat-associated protein
VRYLTDVTGKVTDTYDYDAFGNVVGTTGATANVYRYQGEAFDSETGLYYLRAGYYDPVAGRFLSVDPMANQGQHPYTYAGADPVNGRDPTGTQDIIEYTLLLRTFIPPRLVWRAWKGLVGCVTGGGGGGSAVGRLTGVAACFGGGDGPSGPPKPRPNCECGIQNAPQYDKSGGIRAGTAFHWSADFLNDATHDPTCCEVRQYLKWNINITPSVLFRPP